MHRPLAIPTIALPTLLAALVVAAAMGGCGKNEERLYVEDGRLYSTASGRLRASKELTLKQGTKLLEDIRKDPKKMDKLTPEERRFLGKAALVNEDD